MIPHKKFFGGSLPYAFTEQGVAMLSSILNSEQAIKINIAIMRAGFGRELLLVKEYEKYGMWSLSKNSVLVILRFDRGIQKILKTLDSRFRENDDFLWKCQFLDRLSVPNKILFLIKSNVAV